ncbi:hypothetical protein B0H66DRAFT_624516 [Apodospora peruviana]|uniref:Uncharacterized protein n=1 Tax=Apodospora peruviana TaxID=516989 RepID=A0AAE0HZH8_9PEZI|nr:hypothetical protein B0H66DRAFT_624516 [Apodospora peruviana]
MRDLALLLMYRRDITDFDCSALRWSATYCQVSTMERTLFYEAPVTYIWQDRDGIYSSFIQLRFGEDDGADVNQVAIISRRDGRRDCYSTPLFMAMHPNIPSETVKRLLVHGAYPEMGAVKVFKGAGGQVCRHWDFDAILKVEDVLTFNNITAHYANLVACIFFEQPRLFGFYDTHRFEEVRMVLRVFVQRGVDLTDFDLHLRSSGTSLLQGVIRWSEIQIADGNSDVNKIRGIYDKLYNIVELLFRLTLDHASMKSPIVDTPIEMKISDGQTLSQTPLGYFCNPFRSRGRVAEQMVKLLLAAGPDINATDSNGVTALHRACMFSRASERCVLDVLLEHKRGPAASGLNINARDSQGRTPLHYAVQFGFRSKEREQCFVAGLLIKYGAQVDAYSNSHITPLFLAVRSSKMMIAADALIWIGGAKADNMIGWEPDNAPVWFPLHGAFDDKISLYEDSSALPQDYAAPSEPLSAAECYKSFERRMRKCVAEIREVTGMRFREIKAYTPHHITSYPVNIPGIQQDVRVRVVDRSTCRGDLHYAVKSDPYTILWRYHNQNGTADARLVERY